LQIGQLEIEPDARVHVVTACAADRTPLIFQLSQPNRQRLVVGDDEPALASGDRLVRRERKAACPSERPEVPPGMTGEERFGGVLNDHDAAIPRKRQNMLRGRRTGNDMAGRDGRSWRGGLPRGTV